MTYLEPKSLIFALSNPYTPGLSAGNWFRRKNFRKICKEAVIGISVKEMNVFFFIGLGFKWLVCMHINVCVRVLVMFFFFNVSARRCQPVLRLIECVVENRIR